MRKWAIAGFAFAAGFCSWFISRIPPERIVRVKPSDKWTDIYGYGEDEFVKTVSKNTKIIPRYFDYNPSDGILWLPITDEEICVKKLTFYDKYGDTFLPGAQYAGLTLREAEKLIQEAHQKRMHKTTVFHQMVMS